MRAIDRVRHDHGVGLLTAVGMATIVLLVYLAVVVGGGALVGRTGSPAIWLSVLATAIVAIAFEPIRVRLRRVLLRLVHQDVVSPYDLLARFPEMVAGTYPTGALTEQMARVLGEGTGARRAEVWLRVQDRLELAASWPEQGPGPGLVHGVGGVGGVDWVNGLVARGGDRVLRPVTERGELLGVLAVVPADRRPLSPMEDRLFSGLAGQSGLVLRLAALRQDLRGQLAELERGAAALVTSRRELVARQDAERKRLERNIHDGAQQQVIALLVNLRLAQTLWQRAPDRAAPLLAEQAGAARDTVETLTGLSLGLYPPLLTTAGVEAAVRSVAHLGPIPVSVDAVGLGRYPVELEAAAYFCCLEALQNANKHSGASGIRVTLRGDARTLEVLVADDGVGLPDDRAAGAGLRNMRDRVTAVDGSLRIERDPAGGTIVHATIPMIPMIPVIPVPVVDGLLDGDRRERVGG